jgi:hypothetical protein
MAAVNKQKSELGASAGRVATKVVLGMSQHTLDKLRPALSDVVSSVRAEAHEVQVLADAAPDVITVISLELTPPSE